MKRSILFGVGLGLVLSACSDTTGPQGGRLTRDESLVFMANILATSEGAMIGSLSDVSGSTSAKVAGSVPVEFTHSHEATYQCPSGGTLDIAFELEGMVDEEAGSLEADLTGSHTHNACAFPHNDVIFTVTGDPNLVFTASIGAENGAPSQPFTFTLDGGITWTASDGREPGSCSIAIDAVTDFAAKQRTVVASICGHTFNDTFSWETQ